jgi:hypothetical protein
MNRRQRRHGPFEPYEEPWWKWAGIPTFKRTSIPPEERRETLRGALVTIGLVAVVFAAIAGILWIVGHG